MDSNKIEESIGVQKYICSDATIGAMEEKPRTTPYPLRMPDELRESLEAASASGNRSLHAEIISRLEASFESSSSDDVHPELQHQLSALATERDLLRDTGGHLQKIIAAQDVNIIMLQAYLIDVINALPKKLQSDERVKIATKFALDLGGDESQAFQMPLAIGHGTQSGNVHATVRGKDVDTGIPLRSSLRPGDQHKNESGKSTSPVTKVILVPGNSRDPEIGNLPARPDFEYATEKTPPNKGPTRSPNARKPIPKK